MVFLVGFIYLLGIIGAVFLVRRKSYYAIPVIVALVGLDMLLGSSVIRSHLESISVEYAGLSYLGFSAFLFLMLVVL